MTLQRKGGFSIKPVLSNIYGQYPYVEIDYVQISCVVNLMVIVHHT